MAAEEQRPTALTALRSAMTIAWVTAGSLMASNLRPRRVAASACAIVGQPFSGVVAGFPVTGGTASLTCEATVRPAARHRPPGIPRAQDAYAALTVAQLRRTVRDPPWQTSQ